MRTTSATMNRPEKIGRGAIPHPSIIKPRQTPTMKITKLACFLITLSLLLTSDFAWCADGLPSVESFFKDPDVHFAVLSPKGHYVAVLDTVEGNQVLGVRDTSDLKKLTVIYGTNENKILSAHWVNENRILFTVEKFRGTGGVDTFAVDRDGTNMESLIYGNFSHHQQVTGSLVLDKTLTYEYAFFATTHNESDDIIVKKYVFNGLDKTSYVFHLFRLNTKTRKLTDLVEGNQQANVYRELLDANDIPRFAMSKINGQCITSYYSLESKSWSEMSRTDCYDSKQFVPVIFEDENTVFVNSDYKGYQALFRYDIKNKQIAAEPFMFANGFDFVGGPEVDTITHKVLGFHYASDAISTAWIDPHFSSLQKKIDGALTQTVNTIHCGSDCLNSPAFLVQSSSDRQPTQFYIFTPANEKLMALGGNHPDIKPAQMGLRDFYHFKARDGMSIPVYVTQPAGKATKPAPAILLVHGGPNIRGGSWEWESEAQFLASRGYVVIQPEFRGSYGFGFDLYKAGWKQWGQAMQDDLADATQWAIQQGWADPKRVCIMGASYGGYATLMGLIKNPELFRCGVEWAGVTDINMMFDLAESDATQEGLHYDMRTTIGDQKADAEMFKQYSPLNHADRRVPIAQATAFHNAVTDTNKNVEWIIYADEGHGWHYAEDSIDFWKHVEIFLDKNLKNPI